MEESISAAAAGLKIVKNNSWPSDGLYLNYSEDANINSSNSQTMMVNFIYNLFLYIIWFD